MNALVMDVEGTDGREHGEDQVRFWGSRFVSFGRLKQPST